METGLRGRSALITGAASGIGRAIALALAAEGARVVVADIDAERGRPIAEQIGARYVTCDVTDEAMVEAAVRGVVETEGRLDIMVNNAGIAGTPAPIVDTRLEDWERVIAIDLRGVFLGVKHAARAMIQAGSGCIINIASVAGMGGSPRLGPYGVAKAGVIQLTQTAALELARRGIRVNAVCPGWAETALTADFDREKLVRQIPLGRLGRPEEVAAMVVYLASDAAAFVTGGAFPIDGGIRS